MQLSILLPKMPLYTLLNDRLHTQLSKGLKILLLLSLGFWMTTSLAQGQICSKDTLVDPITGACFCIDQPLGCAPHTIRVINCSGSNVDRLSYIYSLTADSCVNINNCFVDETTHTYTEPGIYRVLQLASLSNGTEDFDSLTVQVFPTPEPVFDISFCADREISLEIDPRADNYDEYIVDWGDLSAPTRVQRGNPIERHQYPPGDPTYTVTVRGAYAFDDCGAEATQEISVLDDIIQLSDTLFLNTLNQDQINGMVEVSFQSNADYAYEILSGGQVLTTILGNDAQVNQTISRLNTLEATRCYTVRVVDACGNSVDMENLYCDLRLEAVVDSANGRNIVTWTPYSDRTVFQNNLVDQFQYILFRNGQPFQIFNDVNQSQFIDQNVICKVEYAYQIQARLNFTNSALVLISSSNIDQVTAFSDAPPPRVNRFNATVDSPREVQLFWEIPNEIPVAEYVIERFDLNTLVINNIDTLGDNADTTRNAIDTDINTALQQCYRLVYQNDCGISPEDSEFLNIVNCDCSCPVSLSGTLNRLGEATLNWTSYRNAFNGTQNVFENYVVQRQDEFGVFRDINTISFFETSFVDREAIQGPQILRYRIKTVISNQEEIFSFSNIIELEQDFKIFFPNAFSPNGDGLNDVFKPEGLFISTYQMTIYNRLGKIMFISNNVEEGWDGNLNGSPAPQDAYVYIVELGDARGRSFKTQGTFTLIR